MQIVCEKVDNRIGGWLDATIICCTDQNVESCEALYKYLQRIMKIW